MHYDTKFSIGKIISFGLACYYLLTNSFAFDEFSASGDYKLTVVECYNTPDQLLGEFESERIFPWLLDDDVNILFKKLDNKSSLEVKKLRERINALKVNSRFKSIDHFKPSTPILNPDKDCITSLAARKTSGGEVFLNPKVWNRLSENLKEKSYLELALSEKIGSRARILMGYIASDQFSNDSDLSRYEQWKKNYVVDQYFGELHFVNSYNSTSLDPYQGDINLQKLTLTYTGYTHSDDIIYNETGEIKSFGKLINFETCDPKWPTYSFKDCGIKYIEGNIEDNRVKFPHDVFDTSLNECNADYCSKKVTPAWKVTFKKKNDKTSAETFTCQSFQRNYAIIKDGIFITTIDYYSVLHTCNLEIYGQKLEISKNVWGNYVLGYNSVYEFQLKFSKDQVEFNLPISEEFLDLAKHYYKNPVDQQFYAGRLILNNKGEVLNVDDGAVVVTKQK